MATAWPEWWEWELELGAHVLKRMADRGFSEIDLRTMMGQATEVREGENEPGRWVVKTKHDTADWEVIVEPDEAERLIVVTAYRSASR